MSEPPEQPTLTDGEVTLRLPAVLADLVGGRRSLVVAPAPRTVGELLDRVEADEPAVVRRIRAETGAVRRFVNIAGGVRGLEACELTGPANPLAPPCNATRKATALFIGQTSASSCSRSITATCR